MINEVTVKKCCCEDLSHIENYDKAVADKEQIWHCHHRREFGDNGEVVSMSELKMRGLYFDRPASELIFMTEHDHRSLHGRNMSKETLDLIATQSRNRKHTEETKRRISETKRKHYHPFRGKHLPESMRRKMSNSLKGRVFSEEHRMKLSEAAKRRYAKKQPIISETNACQSNS